MSCRAILGCLAAAAAAVLLLLALSPGPRAAEPSRPKIDPAKGLTPKPVTIQLDKASVADALAKLQEQTGIKVEDMRQNAEDAKIKLNLSKVTFWQALEEIAKAADARVSIYQKEGQVALMDGPYRAVPLSFNGIFRIAVRRLRAERDLESDAHFYTASLEVAWEPGFRPFFLEKRPDTLVVKDDRMRELEKAEEESGRVPVEGGRFATVDLRLPPVPRTTGQLGLLKGELALIGPNKWLQFTFDEFGQIKSDP